MNPIVLLSIAFTLIVWLPKTASASIGEECAGTLGLDDELRELFQTKHESFMRLIDEKFAQQNARFQRAEAALNSALRKLKELEAIEYSTLVFDPRPETDCVNNITADEKFEQLIDWGRRGGAQLEDLDYASYGKDYRGLHAKSLIKNGSVVMAFPSHLLLIPERILQTPIGVVLASKGYNATRHPRQIFAAFLLSERYKNSDSFWSTYLNNLPLTFETMPSFWNDTQLEWIKGSTAYILSKERYNLSRDYYEELVRLVPEFRIFTFNQYFWADTIVTTRVFGIYYRGIESEALVPIGDLYNHDLPADVEWEFDDQNQVFVFTATKDIEPGKQILISYGHKCQSEYFVTYGFTVPNNEEKNTIYVELRVSPKDRFYTQKVKDLGATAHCYLSVTHNDKGTEDCLAWARVVTYDGPGWVYIPSDNGPVSFRSEKRAISLLTAAGKHALTRFSTTLEEDLDLIAKERAKREAGQKTDINYWNALIMRSGEKKVVQFYGNLSRTLDRFTAYLATKNGFDFENSPTVDADAREWVEKNINKEKDPFTHGYFEYFLEFFFSNWRDNNATAGEAKFAYENPE